VALLHEGRVLAADQPSALRAAASGRMVELVAPRVRDAIDEVRRLPGVADAQVFGDRLHVTLDGTSSDAIERFTSALASTRLGGAPVREVTPSLEDVFIARLGAEAGHA
jgi:ABC-2 type transport system ATP-binding protein